MIENPILPGFNPDPSILAAGDWFFIATSTFEWMPGLPIYRSKDLKNWQLCNHGLKSESQIRLAGMDSALGVWAPALSFKKEEGRYYLCYSLVYGAENNNFDVDNFFISTDDILGDWSDPVYLNSSGFDPSLFHDEDGRSWLINLEWDFRQGYEHPGCIVLQEYDTASGALTGSPVEISRGATDRGCLEGPQLYKKNGYYYLINAEGGTGYGHCVTISRSREVTGPYEGYPGNPVVTSQPENFNERGVRNSAKPHRYYPGSYLQKSGHGQIAETGTGEVYITHLCSRPLMPEQRCTLGRETAIQKCLWTSDGWIIRDGEDNMAQRYVKEPDLPEHSLSGSALTSDGQHDFYTPRQAFSSDWMEQEGPRITLRGRQTLFSRYNQSLAAVKVTSFRFDCEVELQYRPESFLQMAGLVNYYNNRNFHYLRLYYSQTLGGPSLGIMSGVDGVKREYEEARVLLNSGAVRLKCSVDGHDLQYYYTITGDEWIPIGPVLDYSILSDEFAGGFTGSFAGITAQDLYRRESRAVFNGFQYKDL